VNTFLGDKELSKSLFEKIGLIVKQRLEYLQPDAEGAMKDAVELSDRLVAYGKVFKDVCVDLAAFGGCPAEVMKLDSRIKSSLGCSSSRCKSIRASNKENICWNIYYKEKFDRYKEDLQKKRIPSIPAYGDCEYYLYNWCYMHGSPGCVKNCKEFSRRKP